MGAQVAAFVAAGAVTPTADFDPPFLFYIAGGEQTGYFEEYPSGVEGLNPSLAHLGAPGGGIGRPPLKDSFTCTPVINTDLFVSRTARRLTDDGLVVLMN